MEATVNNFPQRCTQIAERFLLTAVIVDDQAHYEDPSPPPTQLRKPDRYTSARPAEAIDEPEANDRRHSLDARVLVDAFAERGLICAVIAPRPDTESDKTIAPAAKRADIVVLDWQLNHDNGERALSILSKLIEADAGERLRLVAIYTGEQDIAAIGQMVEREMRKQEWTFKPDDRGVVLSYRHCHIVIYAKSDTRLAPDLKDRSIPEADVPQSLIGDFGDMTTGLLPSIALSSLAAVRDNAHRVLDRFQSSLDAAFLAHRACLSAPEDSQRHIVNQIAGELHAIMDDAAATDNPAGIDAIKEWLKRTAGANAEFTFGENKKLSFDRTVTLLSEGLKKNNFLGEKDFKCLSSGFARKQDSTEELDRQLTWMFNFRTVFNAPPPILHLGTVLRRDNDKDDEKFFLCMRPRCDSARLTGENAFLLLPLTDPKEKTIQLVIRTSPETYRRVSVGTQASEWSLVRFAPEKVGGAVTAEKDNDGAFFFTAVDGTRYRWVGELKAEFAQRIAHHFATGLSRVAVDNSEWLRRQENL
ncbi:response regulator receiver domain [Candidatus Thiosymbion oneisti]|uniref:response regulator receiver domain n=1 Tax=Candidatus Thiosymbion oneisti TaxID=589554 RepID=UPI00114D0367|nr:response regulator receiver domain [Candidatus Thiosymbion oneisti]